MLWPEVSVTEKKRRGLMARNESDLGNGEAQFKKVADRFVSQIMKPEVLDFIR